MHSFWLWLFVIKLYSDINIFKIIYPGFFTFFSNFNFQVNGGAKEQKMAWNDNYVCHTPYLHKHTSYDHVFCYTSLKWWHLQMFFFVFSILCFSGLLEGGVTGQKMAQNDKKFCLTLYFRNCTWYDCVFSYTCVKWWYLKQFFKFFQKSDFSSFSKFINEWQKETLRCASPSHVYDFLLTNNFGKLTVPGLL